MALLVSIAVALQQTPVSLLKSGTRFINSYKTMTDTKPVRRDGEKKLTKKQQKLKELGFTGWLLTATKWETDNCICNEWDGKGISACGFPCPVHQKFNKLNIVRCWLKEFLLTIILENPVSGHDWTDLREYKRHGKLFTVARCKVCGKEEKLWKTL